jgi:hypothetical protein
MDKSVRLLSVSLAAAILAACGGGSMGSTAPAQSSTPQSANMAVMVSDASTEDWATIGVKILSIALVPQGGGANVTVYTAPAPAPVTNLVMLDQLDEILGNASIPVGSYTGAVLTVSGNADDILLTTSSDPEAGFAAPPSTTIPSSQIQVQHTEGSGADLTVPVTVNFDTPLTVSATQSNALDLEFNLAHPAFLVGHVPVGAGDTVWAVNFDGPVRRRARHDLAQLVLRHTYGDVTAISSDQSDPSPSPRNFPPSLAVSPETAVAGTRSLQISADSTNGTIFYDLDAKTRSVIDDFSSESSLAGQVRPDRGALPGGRQSGRGARVGEQRVQQGVGEPGRARHARGHRERRRHGSQRVGRRASRSRSTPNTQFFFREPQKPRGRLAADRHGHGVPLERRTWCGGSRSTRAWWIPLATPLVAQSIDIETAEYSGAIFRAGLPPASRTPATSAPPATTTSTGSLTSRARRPTEAMPAGNPITGYKWWNFVVSDAAHERAGCGGRLRRPPPTAA